MISLIAALVVAAAALLVLIVALRPSRTALGEESPAGTPRSAAAAALESSALWQTVDPWARLTGTTSDELVRQVAWAAAGAGGAALLVVGGAWWIGAGGDASLALVLAAAAAGSAVPVVRLRRRAVEERRAAARAIGTYLDLVVLCLAGGMGIEGAMQAAATVAEDPWSARVGRAVAVAGDAGRPPWDGLAELGSATDLGILEELAATMALAGMEGARVRESLAAKAASLRTRQLAAAEAEANAVTERLFLPGVPLLVGFLVFIGYPALARILTGL